MTTTRYKGYSIQARPYQTHESKQWTVDLEIHRNGRKKPFSLTEHYATKEEAEERCSSLGRRIIDGQIAGWSVNQLRPTGFLRGFRDEHRHPLAATGKILLDLGILAILVVGAIALLGGAYQAATTP